MTFDSRWVYALALAVFLGRLVLRKASRAELIVGFFMIAHFAVVQILMVLDMKRFGVVDWRYHQSELPLLYCFLAWPAAAFYGSGRRFGRVLALCLMLAMVGRSAYKMTKRYFQDRREKDAVALAADWAVKYINADWKGPKTDARVFRRRDYRTNRLPKIVEQSGYIAYRTGGRDVLGRRIKGTRDLDYFEEQPDYVMLIDGFCSRFVKRNGRRPDVTTERLTFNGVTFVFQRRKSNAQPTR